jgi:lipopolysaccharide transport system ATP-binding protein
MSDIAIRTENLGKLYRIGEHRGGYNTLRETIVNTLSAPFRRFSPHPPASNPNPQSDTIWALKDISFAVTQGEVVGIIGRNGAGKTTVLKVLSRITEPTKGWAEIRGRVGSLLEVGTGFHPELTGRENIYLNGAILGMKKAEIAHKFDEIVAFAEIEKFIDTPVKRYSSGMYIRLAFAVAAHLEPEILLVDEVLAVGDTSFQKKCLGKMGEVAGEGRTVLFVSHNMSAVISLCQRAIFLRDGFLVRDGKPESIVQAYLSESQASQVGQGEVFFSDKDFGTETPFILRSLRTVDEHGRIRSDFTNSEPVIVEFEFSLLDRLPHLMIGFELKTASETTVFRSFHNDVNEVLTYRGDPGVRYRLRAVIPERLLNGGLYYINPCAGIHRKKWLVKDLRGLSLNVVFDVPNPDYVYGSSRPGCISPILEWVEVQKDA